MTRMFGCRFSVALLNVSQHKHWYAQHFPSEQNNITYHQLRLHRAWWLFYYISMTHFKCERVWYACKKERERRISNMFAAHTETDGILSCKCFYFIIYLMFAGFYPLRTTVYVCVRGATNSILSTILVMMMMLMWTSFKMFKSPWTWRREQITLNKIEWCVVFVCGVITKERNDWRVKSNIHTRYVY